MATRTIRASLGNATFPLVSDFSGRTIIVPGLDQTYNKATSGGGGDTDKDIGMPQVFYMHNVLPTGYGYKSVGYQSLYPAYAPEAVTDFDNLFVLKDTTGKTVLFCSALGQNYIYHPNDSAWVRVTPLGEGIFSSSSFVTVARAQGRSIIFYENIGAYEYNFSTKTLDVVTLTGLTSTNLLGLCASTNYLIAYDANTIYWSSTTTLTDFVPSLATGAGSEIPNDLRGSIITVLPVTGGFIIYTTENAVLASYSGNVRFPWQFREVANSSGITSPENVTWASNLSFHYAYTTAGVMKIDRGTAEIAFPELTDFLAHRIFEDYDELTDTFTTTYLSEAPNIKLVFIGSRYLVISYGVIGYTHALVFDTSLKRWGKLKLGHADVFELPPLPKFGDLTYAELEPQIYSDLGVTTYAELATQQFATMTPKHDIAFLLSSGEIKLLNFEVAFAQSSGVIVIGKYQLARGNMCRFLSLHVENLFPADSVAVKLLTSWRGKSFDQKQAMTLLPAANPDQLDREYKIVATGTNHSLFFKGRFNLVSLQLKVTNAGNM